MPTLWKSGDRVTLWSKKFTRREENGRVHVILVDKIRVRFPSRQQLCKTEFTMTVVPSGRVIRHEGIVKRYTTYYIFSESFHGGPGSKQDALGGFTTGGMVQCYYPTYLSNLAQLHKDGFKEEV